MGFLKSISDSIKILDNGYCKQRFVLALRILDIGQFVVCTKLANPWHSLLKILPLKSRHLRLPAYLYEVPELRARVRQMSRFG